MRLWLAGIAATLSLSFMDPFLQPLERGAAIEPTKLSVVGPQHLEVLIAQIEAILKRTGVPGAGIAIATVDGIVWTGGIGLADVEQQRRVTGATVFRLGSVTKNVTALGVMQQVERGRLQLGARLRDVAPEVPFSNPWEATHPVSIASLLEHTAGFDFFRFNDDVDYGPPGRPLLSALEINPQARQARWPPGTRMSYSNEGYTAAGYVLEKVTGCSFDDLMRDEIFAPLGMATAAFAYTPELGALLATGYTSSGREEAYYEDMQRPAANMMASPDDMSRYLLLLLRRGRLSDGSQLVSADGLARMEQRSTLPYTGPEAQYGLGTDTADYGGFVAHGHNGVTSGFHASLRYFPQQGVGWVILLNALPSDQALSDIEAELLPFIMADRAPQKPQMGAYSVPANITGYYRDAAPSQEILSATSDMFGGVEIQLRQDGLWEGARLGIRGLLSGPTWQRLIPVGDDGSFRHDDEAIATRYFATSSDGTQVLITPMGYFERSSAWLSVVTRLAFIASVALLGSALLFVPINLIQTLGLGPLAPLLGGLRTPAVGWTTVGPAVLALLPVLAFGLLAKSPQRLGEVNSTTVTIYLLSSLFPLLATMSGASALRAAFDAEVGLVFRMHLILISVAATALTVFAWRAHWLALRTWAW